MRTMVLTDLRVSAAALFLSVALVLTATHYTTEPAESCAAACDEPTTSELVVPAAHGPAPERGIDREWTLS